MRGLFSVSVGCGESLEERALLSVAAYDFESKVSATSFSSSGQTWTVTSPMSIQSGTDLGAPLTGNASPATPGYMDSVFGADERTPGTNVGGIQAPANYVFRASSFDVWPSNDGGNTVYGGATDTLGTVGLNYTLIGKLNNVQVVSANVVDTARTPAQTGNTGPGGYWHHIDLSGTDFATTDIDTIEFVLAAQTGFAMNYLAVDNFQYDSFAIEAVAPTVISPTSASVTATTATLGGNVSADGGAAITERGVVYALTTANNDPLINGTGVTKVAGTGTTGVFTVDVTGLTASSGYSFKAYATNSSGTTYTSVATFTTAAPPAVDYSDAPDTGAGTDEGDYQTTSANGGPSHTVVAGLFLGNSVDGTEDGTLQNAQANADDQFTSGGSDDEDGVLNSLQLTGTEGTAATVTLLVTNTTGSAAKLSGWIDFDYDGVFDNATERVQATVATGTTDGRVTLAFPAIPVGSAGQTYARFRLSTDAAGQNSTGSATDGEVEDYAFSITAPTDGTIVALMKIASGTDGGPTLANDDEFGFSVTSVGDLDGDGVTDLAAGAPYDSSVDDLRGAVHVLLMHSDGTVRTSTKIGSYTGGGPALANFDKFGVSVTNLGDLDGDGVNDLAVGANADATGGDYRGAVHVLLLNSNGTVKSSTKIASGTNGGPTLADGDSFGIAVTSVGDLDGDGVTDLAVGADADDTGGDYRGAVHVLLLNRNGTVKSSTKIADGTGGGPTLNDGDSFGVGVANAGDVDGDGVTDLAVGALYDDTNGTDCGAVHLLFLNSDGTVKSSTKIASDTGGGPTLNEGDAFGVAVTGAGDLDGDGVTDLVVGADYDDTNGPDRGAVHVLLLNSDGTVKSSTKIASDTGGGPTLNDDDSFGTSVANVGDLNGDGMVDLAVGAYKDDTGGRNRGAVHILFLNAGNVAAAPTVTSPTSASITGTTATLGGNVTADGGAAVTERGVVYSLTSVNADPLIGGTGVTKVTATGTTGVFTTNVTGLSSGSGYSFKAYATNSAGTTYSSVDTFSTTATPTLHVSLIGGVLTVEDADNTGKSNSLTVSTSGKNLVVTDSKESFVASDISGITGAALSDSNRTLTIPLSEINTGIVIDARLGTDSITVLETLLDKLAFTAKAESISVEVPGGTTLQAATVTLVADSIDISTVINVGEGSVTLAPQTDGTLINLGGADKAGTLGLTDAELDFITAGFLEIGTATSGAITVSSDIDLANTPTVTYLSLWTQGGVDGTAAALKAGAVEIRAVGAVTLTDSDMAVSTIAVETAGAVTVTQGGSFAVSSVSKIAGLDNTSGTGDVTLTSTGGALTVQNSGLKSKGIVALHASGAIVVKEGGATNSSGTGTFSITSDTGAVAISSSGVKSSADVTVVGKGLVTLTDGGVSVETSNSAKVSLTSTAAGVTIGGAGLVGRGDVMVVANDSVIVTNGGISNIGGSGKVSVTTSAGTLEASQSGIQSKSAIIVEAPGAITVGGSGINNSSGSGDLSVTSKQAGITVTSGGLQSAGKITVVAADSITLSSAINTSGTSDVSVTTTSGSTTIDSAGVASNGNVLFSAPDGISIGAGGISVVNSKASPTVTLTSSKGAIAVGGGGVQGRGDISIDGFGDVTIEAAGVGNTSGLGSISITSRDRGINSTGGGILSNGDITVESVGSMSFIDNGVRNNDSGTGKLSLRSTSGSISARGSGIQSNAAITISAELSITTSDGGVGNADGSGTISLTSNDASINTSTSGVQSTSDIILIAADSITIADGGVSNASGNGTISLTASGGTLTVGGAGVHSIKAVTLTANAMSLTGPVDASTSSKVILQPASDGRKINLGTETVGRLNLTDAELDQVTAKSLTIGSATGGAITISALLDQSSVFSISLIGNTTFAANSSYNFQVGGTKAGEFDTIDVTGTLTIDSKATLNATSINDFVLSTTDKITLITNDLEDEVSGQFAGLPIANALGSKLSASVIYNGGTGNDVTLSSVSGSAPVFTSEASFIIGEKTTAVTTVTATGGGNALTFSISGGADAGKFQITTDGKLSFITAPNFLTPTDSGANNTYEVTILADDGAGGTETQNIEVSVAGVSVTLASGNLLVTETTDTGLIDQLTVNVDLSRQVLVITETTHTIAINVAGANRVDNNTIEVPFSGISGSKVIVHAGLANDSVTVVRTGSGAAFTKTIEVHGDVGNDMLLGSSLDELLVGGVGNDTLTAGLGSDTITGGTGNDRLIETGDVNFVLTNSSLTGLGTDVLSGLEFAELTGGAGVNVIDASGASFPVLLNGGDGKDVLTGSSFNDTVNGGSGNDLLYGAGGRDSLDGGDGDDTLDGGASNDTLNGGAGIDRARRKNDFNFEVTSTELREIVATAVSSFDSLVGIETVTLIGGLTNNRFDLAAFTNTGVAVIEGGGGNDTVLGSEGSDSITTGSGVDVIEGRTGNDSVSSGEGDDIVNGGAGNDSLSGEGGNDSLIGGLGDDVLLGSGGKDTLTGNEGDDTMNGGAAVDLLSEVADTNFTLTNTSLTGVGDDVVSAVESALLTTGNSPNVIDASAATFSVSLNGGPGPDTLTGSSAADVINGGAGNDTLYGLGGQDVLFGSFGDDFLDGGASHDTLIGADGIDTARRKNNTDFLVDNTAMKELVGDVVIATDLFSSIETVSIAGGVGGNRIDLSAFTNTGIVTIQGGGGDDTIIGSNGQDLVTTTSGADVIDGRGGSDTISSGDGADSIRGGDGNDSLNGQGGDDTVLGEAGDDNLGGSAGIDQIDGGTGANRIVETADGSVVIAGLQFTSNVLGNNDEVQNVSAITLRGGVGNNLFDARRSSVPVQLLGGDGNDTLLGSNGRDLLQGGSGNDVIQGGNNVDTIDGGLGTDILYETGNADFIVNKLQVTVGGSALVDFVTAIEGIVLVGGVGNNTLDARLSSVPVTLLGGGGNDVLNGSEFADVLIGGNRASSASGRDTLNGQAGNDLFDTDPNDTRTTEAGDQLVADLFAQLPSWIDAL